MLDRRRLMLTAAALTVGGAANPALANPSPRDEALAAAFGGSGAPALAGAVIGRDGLIWTAAISSASSTAFLIDSTVLSMLTTTPFRKPRERLDPTPMILIAPSSVTSATMAQIFVVPMSNPTTM